LIGPGVVQQLSQGRWHEVLQGWAAQGQIKAEALQYEYDYLKAIGHSYHPEQVRAAAQEAEDCFVQALRRQPDNTAALVNLAAIKTESALIFYLETGTPDRVRLQEARSLFNQAHALLERRPDQQGRIALAACLLYEATSLPPQAVLESVKWAARQRRQLQQQEGRDAQAGVHWEVVQRNLARRDPQFIDWQKIKRASQILAGAGATALLFFAQEALALRPELLKLVNAGCLTRRAFLVGGASATAAVVATVGALAATGHLPPIFGSPTPTVTNTPQTRQAPGTTTRTYSRQSDAITGVGWRPGGSLALAAPRSGGGPLIASASVDSTVAVWDANSGTTVTLFTGHRKAVRALAWSPDGSNIASCGDDGSAQIWDAVSGKVSGHLQYDFPTTAIAWSPDGQRIAVGDLVGNVHVLASPGRQTTLFVGALRSFGLGVIYTLAWSPDGQQIAAGGALHVSTLDADNGLRSGAAIQPGPVNVWDANSGNLLAIYTGQTKAVRALSWSPDSQSIASGSDDSTVQVWHARDGSQLLNYSGHKDVINGVSWQPSGNMIASASADGTAQVWDGSSGKTLLTYSKHPAPVTSIAWSPGSTRIASGDAQGQVRIWISPAVG
jgi:WD40 repeat protein